MSSAPSPPAPPRRRWPARLILALLVAVAVAVVVMIGWTGQRFDRLIDSGKRAQARIEGAARSIPMPSAAALVAPPTARQFEQALAAREALAAALGSDPDAKIEAALRDPGPGHLAFFAALLGVEDRLVPAAEALAARLEADKLHPLEYRRRIGILARAAIDHPDRHPAGARYNALIDALGAGGRPAERVGIDLTADRIRQSIADQFPATPAPPAALVDRLTADNPLLALADLVALTAPGGGI
jgi:hypothetical protein